MKHPYDAIHHSLILALRAGTNMSEQALVAHYTKGCARSASLRSALEYADEITKAAAALRAEIERLEAEQEAVA